MPSRTIIFAYFGRGGFTGDNLAINANYELYCNITRHLLCKMVNTYNMHLVLTITYCKCNICPVGVSIQTLRLQRCFYPSSDRLLPLVGHWSCDCSTAPRSVQE